MGGAFWLSRILYTICLKEDMIFGTFLAPHPKNYMPTEGFGKPLGKDIVAK